MFPNEVRNFIVTFDQWDFTMPDKVPSNFPTDSFLLRIAFHCRVNFIRIVALALWLQLEFAGILGSKRKILFSLSFFLSSLERIPRNHIISISYIVEGFLSSPDSVGI